jgi:large subunit ribosomal protein L31
MEGCTRKVRRNRSARLAQLNLPEKERATMKEGIHPNYREVCFLDLSNNFKFVTRSCANAKEMIKMEDGRELPLYKLDTSSESHPFYTGTQKSVDNMGGRVERFRNRFGKTAAK